MKNYFIHLIANWKVALHASNDMLEHLVHGLIPVIKWKHFHENKIKKK
jgi:hypothetical protein